MAQFNRCYAISIVLVCLLTLTLAAKTAAQGQAVQGSASPQGQMANDAGDNEPGEQKGQKKPTKVLTFNSNPSSSSLTRLKLHWKCLKAGGKWTKVSDTANEEGDKGFSETRTWVCKQK